MAVNKEQLSTDLETFGEILFCDKNNEKTFIVVMQGVVNKEAVEAIINLACSSDYPNQNHCTLRNGVYKCERGI